MRCTRLWAQLLDVRGVIVGGIEVEEDDDGEIAGLIVSARLRKAEAGRCGVCRRRSGQYVTRARVIKRTPDHACCNGDGQSAFISAASDLSRAANAPETRRES